MRLLLPFLILVVPILVVAQGQVSSSSSGIQCSTTTLRNSAKWIAKSYTKRDITDDVTTFKKRLSACGVKSHLGIDIPHLESLIKVSQRSRLERIKSTIEMKVDFQKVDEHLSEFIQAAKADGMSEKDITTSLERYKTRGKQSYDREKISCKPVDKSQEFGPVRDQGKMGWCYAFASADLFSHRLNKKISAADIAFTSGNNWIDNTLRFAGRPESELSGAFANLAMKDALKKGLCLEKEIPSEDNKFGSVEKTLSEIERLRDENDTQATLNCESVKTALGALFPDLQMQDVQEILKSGAKNDLFSALAGKSCNRIHANLEVENHFVLDSKSASEQFDKYLDTNKPFTIGYNIDLLYNKDVQERVSSHASVVVGRRFNEQSGQCEYLVRNSMGPSCTPYDASYDCKDGQVWISKANLVRNTFYITGIK